MFWIIMEGYIDPDLGTTNSSVRLKQEPTDGNEEYDLGNYVSDNLFPKTLILNYEEWLEDVKLEEEDELNPDLTDNFATKQVSCKEEIVHQEAMKNENKTAIEMVTCSKCLYTNTEDNVKRHNQRVHVLVTKHFCPFCNKKNFKEPLSLDSHILHNHTDIRGALDLIKRTIFKCPLCCYKSLKRTDFTNHLHTHGESGLKKCLKDDHQRLAKELAVMEARKSLPKTSPTTKFDCLHCSYSAKQKSNIINHLRRLHTEDEGRRLHKEDEGFPFSCKGCTKKFNEKHSLDSHIIKCHIEKEELVKSVTRTIYECDLCNYKDMKKNKVLRHKRAKHVKKKGQKGRLINRKFRLKEQKKTKCKKI